MARLFVIYLVLTKPTGVSWASGITLAIVRSPTSGSAVTLLAFSLTIFYVFEDCPLNALESVSKGLRNASTSEDLGSNSI